MKSTVRIFTSLKEKHPEIIYILGIFTVTRAFLVAIGLTSLRLLQGSIRPNACVIPRFDMFSHHIVNMWLAWDSGNYYNIAAHGYWVDRPNYGFFPLYPLTIRLVHYITHASIPIIGIVLSNIAILLACWLLYQLVRMDYPKDIAKRSVKYLLLFPAGFIFSGMLTESYFVLFAIASLYFARKSKWAPAGISGGLLALTRHIGVFVVIPLAFEYFRQKKFKLKNIRLDVLLLALVPGGLLLYMLYNKHLTGDYLAFAKILSVGITTHNPLSVIWSGLHTVYVLPIAVTALFLIALCAYVRKLPSYLWLYGVIFLIAPLIGGGAYNPSLLRYTLVVFPVAIAFAQFAKTRTRDELLTIGLALLQGFLMVTWVNCWLVYVV